MIGRLVATAKKYPEITPLLVVCSFAASFGAFSFGRFLLTNKEVTLNHRDTNWEKQEVKEGRVADRVLAIHLQDKNAPAS